MEENKSNTMGKLSINNENCLKGILALLIIFSHSTIANTIKIGNTTLGSLNYFIVAIFFFISGFGLMKQSKANKEFNILKKMKQLLIPYYIVGFLWLVFFDKNFTIDSIIRLLLFYKVVPYCWYVRTQLILYFIWWITNKICDQYHLKSKSYIFLLVFVQLFVYAFSQRFNSITSTTYITVFNFLFGMIYSYYDFKIYRLFKKIYVMQFIIFAFVVYSTIYFPREETFISYVVLNVTSGLFSVAIFHILYIVDLNNLLTLFLGKISYCIYIVQCIAECIFHKTYFCNITYYPIDDIYLVLLLTVVVDILLATVINMISNFIGNGLIIRNNS